jgi:hypothetical protein
MKCPGSIRMSEGIKEDPSPYAEEGSAAHFLAEICLRKARVNANFYEGRVIRRIADEGFSMLKAGAVAEDGDRVVAEDMIEAVQVYLDALRQDSTANPSLKLEIEKTFDLSNLHPDLGGTNDALLWEDYGRVILYDYKHGAGYAVDVENNPQLLYYALGAYKSTDCGDIELVIVQPRARHRDGPVRRHRLTAQELLFWANEKLVPAAKATEDPAAPLKSGDWCRFCRARATCPELLNHAQAVTKSDLKTIPLPPPDALTMDEMVKVLQSKDLLTGWLAAVEGRALSMLQEGQAVPGYKLVRGRSTRRWLELAANQLVQRIPGRDLFERKLKGIPAIEKIIKHDKLAVDISDLYEKPDGKITIAPEADKRPAINPRLIADQFTNIPEEF